MRDIKALQAYQAARVALPWDWRAQDCYRHVAGAVKLLGGPDMMAGLPPWTDEASALAVAEQFGGLEAIVNARLTPIAPALAQRGDVVAIKADGPFKIALALLDGQTISGPIADRTRHLPRRLAILAWNATAPRTAPAPAEPGSAADQAAKP